MSSDTPTARPDEFWLGVFKTQARARLMQFIRAQVDGGCKILSLGDECLCPRCDVDRLFTLLERTQAEREALREALANVANRFDIVPCGEHDHGGQGLIVYYCPWCEADALQPEPVSVFQHEPTCALMLARAALTAPASAAPAKAVLTESPPTDVSDATNTSVRLVEPASAAPDRREGP